MTAWPGVFTWARGNDGNETRLNEISDALRYLKEQSDLANANLAAGKGFFRSLVMRTQSDPSVANNIIALHRLDQAILDTGQGVADWVTTSPLLLDISAPNGGGALDVATEQASTWYQIYGIHKSTDGTKALLGHRAKDYFLDESYDGADTTVEIRKATGTRTAVGQGFKVDTTGPLAFIDVLLIRVGAVTGTIKFELRTDDGAGKPTSTVVATSDIFDAALIDTSALWVRFLFRSLPTLTATTQYHLVATGSWTASDSVYIGWRCDTSSASYANGTRTQLEAGTWNNTGTTTHDFSFKVYVVRNDSPVTMPAGYDGKILLGYAYNLSSSDLRAFQQWDHDVIPLAQTDIGSPAGAATVPTLVDLSVYLPPTQVKSTFWIRNGVDASSDIRVGPVPDGYSLGAGSRGQARVTHGSATLQLGRSIEPVITEAQGVYVRIAGGTIDFLGPGPWQWL